MSDLHCRRAFDMIVATSCSMGVLPMVTPKDQCWHLDQSKWPSTYLRTMPNKVHDVIAKPHFFSSNQISDNAI